MLEPIALAGMIFSLLVLLLIGGVILLFPLTRRLGQVLETYLQDRRATARDQAQLEELRQTVRLLREEVEWLAEQQTFTQALLEQQDEPASPRGRRTNP